MENKLAPGNHQIHLIFNIPRRKQILLFVGILAFLFFASLGTALAYSTKLKSEGDAEYTKQNYTCALLKYEAAKSWWLPEKISPRMRDRDLESKTAKAEIMAKLTGDNKGAQDTLKNIEIIEKIEEVPEPTVTPLVIKTPTKAIEAPTINELRNQIADGISQFNGAVKKITEQKQKVCDEETNRINEKYKSQLDDIASQIADYEKKDGTASLITDFDKKIEDARRASKIFDLRMDELSISQEKNKELSTFCNLTPAKIQPMSLSDYLHYESKLPASFHIQSDEVGGYLVYNNNLFLLRISPDGEGGYTL